MAELRMPELRFTLLRCPFCPKSSRRTFKPPITVTQMISESSVTSTLRKNPGHHQIWQERTKISQKKSAWMLQREEKLVESKGGSSILKIIKQP